MWLIPFPIILHECFYVSLKLMVTNFFFNEGGNKRLYSLALLLLGCIIFPKISPNHSGAPALDAVNSLNVKERLIEEVAYDNASSCLLLKVVTGGSFLSLKTHNKGFM